MAVSVRGLFFEFFCSTPWLLSVASVAFGFLGFWPLAFGFMAASLLAFSLVSWSLGSLGPLFPESPGLPNPGATLS